MAIGITNWVTESNITYNFEEARNVLKSVKRERYCRGKKYKLVKICDHPLTYKEVKVF